MVCCFFLDVILSNLYLQYTIDLAQNGMVDGRSSTLAMFERQRRLRVYSSNFREGIFNREGNAAHPNFWRQLYYELRWSTLEWSRPTNPSSGDLYVKHYEEREPDLFLSFFIPGSTQAGIQSRRWLTPVSHGFREAHEELSHIMGAWDVDCVQDLMVIVEGVANVNTWRSITIHFRSISRSKATPTAHPDAARASVQAWPLYGQSSLAMECIGALFVSLCLTGENVIWQVMADHRGVDKYFVDLYNWRTAELTKRINFRDRRVHVVPLHGLPLLVTMQDYKGGLAIHSFSESMPDPICLLLLPDIPPGEPDGLHELVVSQRPQTSEGHFRPDPEHSIVAISRRISEAKDASFLLIPLSALRTQVHAAESSQAIKTMAGFAEPDTAAPVRVVPWDDWGPMSCLRLRLPLPLERSYLRSTRIPFGSRMPLVISDPSDDNQYSIYVFEVNSLAARYARSVVAGHPETKSGESRATAIVAPENLESVLPGVVDPKCSAIPYAVYRFPLVLDPQEFRGLQYCIDKVEMNMTGFTVTFELDDLDDPVRAQTWEI